MSLMDLFRPKWKHTDFAKRLEVVLTLDEQSDLAWVAENDEANEVRLAAIARISDNGVLCKVFRNDADKDVKIAAQEMLMGLLWKSESSAKIKELIGLSSDDALDLIVQGIPFHEYPLNGLAEVDSLAKRASLSAEFALQLLKSRKTRVASVLVGKIQAHLRAKSGKGSRRGGGVPDSQDTAFRNALEADALEVTSSILARYRSRDFWRIDEMLKAVLFDIGKELLTIGNPGPAAEILSAVSLDYPDDLDVGFWHAAAFHNHYLDNKSDGSIKAEAKNALEEFVRRAMGHPKFEANRSSFEELLKTYY